MKTYFLYISSSLLPLMISPALAQSATPGASDQVTQRTDDDKNSGLDDIVVTAQRRAEDAQRIGVAIDVISAGTLKGAGVTTTDTLNAAVPALSTAKGAGVNASYFIRGVGNFTNNGYSDSAVAFNVDGVYYARPGSTTGTFFDIERVEVLKGPQGTLYGRNATGGAINVISVKPKIGETGGYASVGYGNYNALNLEGALNLPMGENGALRVSGSLTNRDGYNKDGTSDDKGGAFRVQMLADLTPDLTVLVGGDYAHIGGMGVGGSYTGRITTTPGTAATATSPANYTFQPSGLDAYSGLLSPEGSTYFAGQTLGGPKINPAPLNRPYQNNDFYGAHLELNWQTPIGTLTVIPSWRNSRIDTLYNGPSFRGGLIREYDEQFTGEVRFTGKRVGPVDWLIGGFLFDENIKGNYTISQYQVQSYQAFTSHTRSYAGFSRLTFNVTDRFRLIGAIRYTQDDKSFNGLGQNLIETCASATTCIGGPSVPVASSLAALGQQITVPSAPGPANSVPYGSYGNRLFYTPVPVVGTLDRNRVTYRLAAEYDLAPHSLLYASYETGFRSGGFNFTIGRPTYDPEYIKAFTIGMKNRFLDNRLQLNIEAYRWDYTNQQVGHFGIDATGGNSYFTENIGKSRIQGVDVDAQFKAGTYTLLRGSFQYLDNTLTSFIYNTVRNTTSNAIPPIVGCPASAGTATLPGSTTSAPVWVVNCSGQPGYNSPKYSFNGGFDQSFPLPHGLELVATLDGRYRSNRVTSFEFLPFQNSGDTFTMDASLRLATTQKGWSLTGYVYNLTNQQVQTIVQFAGTSGNVVVTNYAPPRTYGVRAQIAF